MTETLVRPEQHGKLDVLSSCDPAAEHAMRRPRGARMLDARRLSRRIGATIRRCVECNERRSARFAGRR